MYLSIHQELCSPKNVLTYTILVIIATTTILLLSLLLLLLLLLYTDTEYGNWIGQIGPRDIRSVPPQYSMVSSK